MKKELFENIELVLGLLAIGGFLTMMTGCFIHNRFVAELGMYFFIPGTVMSLTKTISNAQ